MENPARLRFSLTHSAAPATAATSPRSQFPPTVALLFPSLLRKAGITATGPQDAPDSEERLWLLPSRRRAPSARPQLPGCSAACALGESLCSRWCACGGCRRGELFLIVQVPVGAVVKQLREGVRKSRSQRKGGVGGGRGRESRARKAEGEGKQCWKTQRFMNIWAARMESRHQRRMHWKAVDSLREVYFNSFFPFSFCC